MRRYAILTLSVCLLAFLWIYTHAGAGLNGPSSYIETTLELFSGTGSGIAAEDSEGELLPEGVQGMIFSSQEDFRSGTILWNVSIREEGGVVLNRVPSYYKYLLPHWRTMVRNVYMDESTGNTYYTDSP